MRLEEIRTGEAYTLAVPERLPPDRYPAHVAMAAGWFGLLLNDRYRPPTLTVTQVHDVLIPDVDGADQPGYALVAGFMCSCEPQAVDIRLTEEQREKLGLPPGRPWRVMGFVADETGHHARFPRTIESIVPARWLRPPGWTPYDDDIDREPQARPAT